MKITGHTDSVTIRSQLRNTSGSGYRLGGARAASPEFTHEHCVFARKRSFPADSSYLNRPIVGPTPPKLPARGSNLRHHRVFLLFAGAFIDYYKHPPKSSVYTNFLQKFCVFFQTFFGQNDSPETHGPRAALLGFIRRRSPQPAAMSSPCCPESGQPHPKSSR